MPDELRTWTVTMRGLLGYTCIVHISLANAKTEDEAMQIARWMFRELFIVSATREFDLMCRCGHHHDDHRASDMPHGSFCEYMQCQCTAFEMQTDQDEPLKLPG